MAAHQDAFDRDRLRYALAEPPPQSYPATEPQREAAIALVLLEAHADLEFLLIERATRSGDPWSGHMALPGGHWEATDRTLARTAERETREEVGIDLQATAELLGRLSDYAPARGVPIAVRPFVYLIPSRPTLLLSAEVEQAFWVPSAPLRRGERKTTFRFSRAGREWNVPAWDIDGHLVWGLTYRVLEQFFQHLDALFGSP